MSLFLDHIPNRTVVVNGKEQLYFGGTAYLGLQSYPPYLELYLENVKKYGMHYGASRKANIKLEVYDRAEKWLANWVGSEACLTLSSGYLAAQLVIQTLLSLGHPIIGTPNSHIALHMKGVVKPKDFEGLQQQVHLQLAQKNTLPPVVLFDTIDFSGTQFPNFESLQQLPLDRTILVGDDSHGIGVVGNNGNGCFSRLKQLWPSQLVVCCSLGKGLGIQAGAVFGSDQMIKTLANTAFFGGASPAPPAFMGTLLEAGPIYSERRALLMEHLTSFKNSISSKLPLRHVDGHPSFEFCNPKLAKWLEKNGFIFTNFNYPDEHGPVVSRIVLSAYHKDGDIQELADCLNAFAS
nr:pyridoxal phosphate-dependent aminotransferase family protein [Allomuricauda sp.]